MKKQAYQTMEIRVIALEKADIITLSSELEFDPVPEESGEGNA